MGSKVTAASLRRQAEAKRVRSHMLQKESNARYAEYAKLLSRAAVLEAEEKAAKAARRRK